MKKKANQIDSLPLHAPWDEGDIMEWLNQNRGYLAWGILGLVALLFILYRFQAGEIGQAEQDYASAARSVAQLSDKTGEPQALAELQEILKRRPNLQAKYDGVIAQNLLILGDVENAEPFAERTFKRVSNENVPFYIDYARNSFTIEKGEFDQALAQAQGLKLAMQNGKELHAFGPMLYIFNLIRIGMLQKQLGQQAEEKKSWQELMKLSAGDSRLGISATDLQQVIQHVEERGISLANFIEER